MRGLSIRGLSKSYADQPVLTELDLTVEPGSLAAILGPSGSGKTTLLRVIAGFEVADAGTVTIGDEIVDGKGRRVAPEHRHVGYVPQEGALFPHLTVGRNVAFGVSRKVRRSGMIGDLLEMVGMRGMGRRFPHQLSGGQQQRVAVARALAVRPGLVLLDEPFSSLDPGLRASVRADVAAVLRKTGATAILVTHDQDEALSWADQVAVMQGGRIGQSGTPAELYGRPADPKLARFLGEANLMPGVRSSEGIRTPVGILSAESSTSSTTESSKGEVVVLVRPEQLLLHRDPKAAPLTGRVTGYEYFGHDAVVRVEPDSDVEVPMTHNSDLDPNTTSVPGPDPDPAPGSDVESNVESDPRPEGRSASRALVVRTDGTTIWEVGAEVGISAVGPVVTWPR